MKQRVVSIIIILFSSALYGQCPDRNFLWHRIIFLRDSSTVVPGKQLDELLGYQKKINQCAYRDDSTHALLLQRIGWLYTTKNDFFSAIEYTQKSIALVDQQKNNPRINPALAIKSYWNLCLMYDSLKLESKMTAVLDSCISHAIYLKTGYDYELGAIKLIVPRLFSIGDYYRCVTYATLGESLISKTGNSTQQKEEDGFTYFTWKISALIFLHKTDEARNILAERIRLAENNRKINLLGTLYGLYAGVLREKGDPIEAISYFKKNFQYDLQIGHKAGCAEALNNIGYTYSNYLHQNKMAISYHFKALRYANANESLNILDNIANIYAESGNYDSAFFFFQKAFDQVHPGFADEDILKIDNAEFAVQTTEYITGLLLDKAAAWSAKYKATGQQKALDESIRIYELTDRYFDKLKTLQSEIQSQLFWKTNNRRLYEQAVEACYISHNTGKAFYFFEKSRSVLLNDQIMEQRRMSDGDLAKQAQLKKTILEIKRDLRDMLPSSKDYADLQQQLVTKSQEQEILLKNINGKYPSYTQHYPDSTSINISQVQKKILNSNTSLLEIFTGDSAVYVISVTTAHASFIKLDKHLYDSITTAYISFITHPDILNRHFPAFINSSHQLYDLIFRNIQPQPNGSLIISPDGRSFPFEALVINTSGGRPNYLLNQYATSYTYSAKYLANKYAVNDRNQHSVLGIAPVKYKNNTGLAALPGSDVSLEKIKGLFSDATNFVFENATKNNFVQHFPDYGIIQLYTHASDSSSNNDPVIYFSDSAFYLSDLITSHKPLTQLVVLSACETANGKLYEGEGIFSFNRGFAALGIPAAISNLWSVDNESTYRITELFYTYLSKGLPTDIALQKAKLEFINSSPDDEKKLPYFWAGAILTGKVDTIKTRPGFPWPQLAGAAILLLVIAYSTNVLLRRKNKQIN